MRAELAHVLLSHSGLMVPAQMKQQELALQMVLLESLARPNSDSMSCSPQVQVKLRLPLLLVLLWQVARIPGRHRAQDRCLVTAHDQWQIRELSEHPTLDGWRPPHRPAVKAARTPKKGAGPSITPANCRKFAGADCAQWASGSTPLSRTSGHAAVALARTPSAHRCSSDKNCSRCSYLHARMRAPPLFVGSRTHPFKTPVERARNASVS